MRLIPVKIEYLDDRFAVKSDNDVLKFTRDKYGCLHVEAKHGVDTYYADYIHICDVEDFIDALKQIQAMAEERGFAK